MARYKQMTESQIAQRDEQLEDLRKILNDENATGLCIALSRDTGKAYSTIREIKRGAANPHYSTVKMLLKAANKLMPV
ncbi:MAG: hypothetical protein ACPG5Z_06550 [Pseudoalteromonas sp.]